MKSWVREILITLGLAVAIYLIIQTSLQNSVVYDVSMQPTLIAGQRLIVIKPVYNFKEPERGDIIIVRPPSEPKKEFVKRLIGLPGDTVEVNSGTVYVDKVPLEESYIKEKPRYTMAPFKVPENNYFVLGDNRNNSSDSHLGWTVTRDKIVGMAWLRYWPLNKFGAAGGYPLNEQVEPKATATAVSAK
jgi:signal peptidase I